MLSLRDLAYSIFGGPLILDVGPTINGEIIRVHVQPINTISVTALVISVLLFMGFMYIYLSPLFRNRAAAKRARTSDVEQPGPSGIQIDEEEKRSLRSWLHIHSRERFSTHESPIPRLSPELASPPGLTRNPSSFARGSLIPHLLPVTLTPPPPAYASRSNSPEFLPSPLSSPRSEASRRLRTPSPLSSPRFEASRSPRTPSISPPSPALTASAASRVQFNPPDMPTRPRTASPAQGRGRSGTAPSPPTLAVRPFIGPRSVSANTLHPVNADLHLPSRARVYISEPSTVSAPSRPKREGADLELSANGEASTVRRVACPRDGAGLGLGVGIGLAARGRILTRGSSSWNVEVGGTGVGQPF